MKTLFFILFVLIVVDGLNAQDLTKIESDTLVINYVIRRNYSYPKAFVWAYFQLVNGQEIKSLVTLKKQKRFPDSVSTDKWAFADFNADGIKDMVVSGVTKKPEGARYEDNYHLLVYLSQTDGGYSQTDLVRPYNESYPVYFHLMDLYGQPLLRLTSVSTNNGWPPYKLQTDTLKYRPEGFIEYNSNPSNKTFRSFTYSTSSNWVSYSPLTISIDSAGNIFAKRGAFPDSLSILGRAVLQEEELKSFKNLLSYVDSSRCRERYDKAGVHDVETSNVVVDFGDGLRKQIADYGSSGTYGLMALYAWVNWYVNAMMKMPTHTRWRNTAQ